MATYIIGDIHGCYAELQQLLELIQFDAQHDRLGFVGDLVNRGPDSLGVLRFIKNLSNPLVVLGNHDLHLLALGYKAATYDDIRTLQPILNAPDKLELLEWLRHRPLVIYLSETETILVHAGVPPQWTLSSLVKNAEEAATALRGPQFSATLRDLYGNKPGKWHDRLAGAERLRYIVNALTRMRFCTAEGELELTNKSAQSSRPDVFRPWFEWYQLPQRVLFGHWAALEGRQSHPRCEAIDTGCVWGRALTAYRLEDGRRFSTPAINQ